VALVMTGLGLALTAAALLLVGGVLRRRLGALAGTARAFSDGVLEVAPVRGPREVAAASAALNDAVAGLSRLQFQADLLASGELDSPELERAVEGPLGAAIHESVARLVRATRSAEVLRQELAHEATHDPLTGLLNRHAATELLESALRARTRRTHDVAIAFVDLDKFKECNDTLGHQAGDLVLQVTARRMCDTLGDRATLCRLGGDEFLVIASPGVARSALTSLARELVERVSEPIPMTDREIAIGASVGIAFAGPGDTASDLMRHADLALYTAKAGGRGLVHVHETAPDSPAELGAGDAAAPAAADDPAVTLP
jgi:diguanylate cyclase (GGDEF)-like protein